MGGGHSRARPGVAQRRSRVNRRANGVAEFDDDLLSYFILCVRPCDRIRVVNPSAAVLTRVTAIVERHFDVAKAGWDRHYVYTFRLRDPHTKKRSSKRSGERKTLARASTTILICMLSELLFTFRNAHWAPMTPIDLEQRAKHRKQVAICFRKRAVSNTNSSRKMPNGSQEALLCLETYNNDCLRFHSTPNTVLFDVATTLAKEWQAGVLGVSSAVSSVIADYVEDQDSFPVIGENNLDDETTQHTSQANVDTEERLVRLRGRPWSGPETNCEDAICSENLVLSLVACLARAQYKMVINLRLDDVENTVLFFFVKEPGKEIRLPTFCGVGIGQKDGLYVYRPTITRTKTSFFRNRGGRSMQQRMRQSFRALKGSGQGETETSDTNTSDDDSELNNLNKFTVQESNPVT